MKATIVMTKTKHSNPFPCNFKTIPGEWIQITEPQEVDFILLPEKEVLDKELALVEQEINETKGRHFAEMNTLERRKAELLSITYESGERDSYEQPTSEQLKSDYDDAN